MNRNTWAATAATILVVAVIILGFRVLGSPGTQRMVQSDLRTIRALAELAQQINGRWAAANKLLPEDLTNFPITTTQDLVSGKSFGYRAKSSSEYELCATFVRDNRNDPGINTGDPWIHPKGDYCFQFDASRTVPSVPYYY
jgi:hypothetical protein